MSLVGTAHPALWVTSSIQVFAFVAVMLVMVPAAISTLPVMQTQSSSAA